MSTPNSRFSALQRNMWKPLCDLASLVPAQDGSIEQRLGLLESDLAIRDVLTRYGYSYDARDLDGLMSVIHDDCTLVNPRGTYVGAEAIRLNYQYVLSRSRFSFHHVDNVVVRVADDGTEAGLTAYFNCVIALRSGGLAGGSGTYVIRLLKQGREWSIFEWRITRNTNVSILPATAESPAPTGVPLPPAPTSAESTREWIGPEMVI